MTAEPLFFDPAEPIAGFTFQQPFATAIIGMPPTESTPPCDGPKRNENRSWAPPRSRPFPFWIAVHAGATFYPGPTRETFTKRTGYMDCKPPLWPDCPTFATMPRRAIVGLARVMHAVPYDEATGRERFLHSPAQRAALDLVASDPWAFGPWCWTLDRTVVQLATPIPWPKGALGLWAVPPETLALLRAAREDRALWRTV